MQWEFSFTHMHFQVKKVHGLQQRKYGNVSHKKKVFLVPYFPQNVNAASVMEMCELWLFFFFLQQDLVSFHTILQEEEETFTGLKNSNLLEILLFFLLLIFLSKNVDSFKMIGHDSSQG